ncbi:hypothetical protein AVEN_190154-1, partial [Araneus ventricosus]
MQEAYTVDLQLNRFSNLASFYPEAGTLPPGHRGRVEIRKRGSGSDFSHIEIIESPILRYQNSNKTENHKHRRKLQLHLNSLGEKFHLDLWKNPSLSTSLLKPKKSRQKDSCFYHGESVLHKDSSAAISLCDGVRGYIHTPHASYVIHPLPEHLKQRMKNDEYEKPHIVVRREISPDTFCPHALRKHNQISLKKATMKESEPEIVDESLTFEMNETLAGNRNRERRSTASKSPAIIETAVFIDQALYDQMRRTFPSDTDRQMTTFVLTM